MFNSLFDTAATGLDIKTALITDSITFARHGRYDYD